MNLHEIDSLGCVCIGDSLVWLVDFHSPYSDGFWTFQTGVGIYDKHLRPINDPGADNVDVNDILVPEHLREGVPA